MSETTLPSWDTVASKSTSFTTDELQRFNAAGLDPYLFLVAHHIGLQFLIAPSCQRNLANALSNLPQDEFYGQKLGLGFSDRHIARLLAESEAGFAFLAVIGCLGEYFASDVVVAVLEYYVEESREPPEHHRPADFQWQRLIDLCQGVLATSSFGTMITRKYEDSQLAADHTNISQVARNLLSMGIRDRGDRRLAIQNTGPNAYWFAAVAEFLFDLKVIIRNGQGEIGYKSSGADEETSQIVLETERPSWHCGLLDQMPLSRSFGDMNQSHGPPGAAPLGPATDEEQSSLAPVSWPVSGGRVRWDTLFRDCFGEAFTNIKPLLVAEFTGAAASLLSASLKYNSAHSQEYFLPHANTIRGLSGYGLVETVTSWFPEMRRQSSQMGKAAQLPFQEARDKADKISEILESDCMCNLCGNAPATSEAFCQHSLVEMVLELGLFIARTVVKPNLFPKRSGILAMYRKLHAFRMLYRAQEPPSAEAFQTKFVAVLPTPRKMIETMCLLFTGSVSRQITDHTLCITHEGITVSLSANNTDPGVPDPQNEHFRIRQRAGVHVTSGSAHLNGRVSDHTYWVPIPLSPDDISRDEPMSFSESIELMRTRPREVKQVVKWRMGDVLLSIIMAGRVEEERVTNLGWLVL